MFFGKSKKNLPPGQSRQRTFRETVLYWALHFAEYYASQKTVDPRAMPTQLPLGRLLVVIDRYLANGIEGITHSAVIDLIEKTEGLQSKVQVMSEQLDIGSVPEEVDGV